MKIILSFCSFAILIFSFSIQAESNSKLIYVGEFRPLKSQEDATASRLFQSLKSELQKDDYTVQEIPYNSLQANLDYSKRQNARFYLSGFYGRSHLGNLEIYAQVYNPSTGKVIDAFSSSDEILKIEGLDLSGADLKQDDSVTMDRFTKRLALKLKINPTGQEKRQEIMEHLSSTKVSGEESFPIAKSDISKEAEQVFRIMEEIEVVSATKTKVKISEAPAAVYVITAKQIRERGYRTLVDALKDLPGFDFQHNYGIFPELIHQRGLIGNNNRTNIYIDGIQDNNINENGFLPVPFVSL
jgi:outer membrane receptor protein involved in Fe transport